MNCHNIFLCENVPVKILDLHACMSVLVNHYMLLVGACMHDVQRYIIAKIREGCGFTCMQVIINNKGTIHALELSSWSSVLVRLMIIAS